MKKKQKKTIKHSVIALFIALVFFFLFGIITALIPNQYFIRMVPTTPLDFLFLGLTAILLGSYISLTFYSRNKYNKCDSAACGGGFVGVFSFACPICNSVLVALFGATALLTYFEPYRPVLGLVSIGILGFALYYQIKHLQRKT